MINQEKQKRIEYLVEFLKQKSEEYYNQNNPTISDAEFDSLFDELLSLEEETGYILEDSPTQKVGFEVKSALTKVKHDFELLSLAKTKDPADVFAMSQISGGFLGLKLDGLTVKITYSNGKIIQAATRGDGQEGEDITHNAKVFVNLPKTIDYKKDLIVSGEAIIDIPTFERINQEIENDEEKYSTPRNLAAGSVRQLDSKICASRGVRFVPFNVLKGFEEETSKHSKLLNLKKLGFEMLDTKVLTKNDSVEDISNKINKLKEISIKKGYPIDGIVFSYDDINFARSQGKTSHHFKDGIAFKFGDPHFETTLKEIEWNISRTGQLTPAAVFDPVLIDNTKVERASLHNMTFVQNLKLLENDKILVSKRNMIIPHVEENLSSNDEERENYTLNYPSHCPICDSKTEVTTTQNQGKNVSTLYCKNVTCAGRQMKKFTHFVSKQAMNIEGLSESTLQKFVQLGFIKSLKDIYNLKNLQEEITTLKGFGQKSFNNLIDSIEKSKNANLSNFLVAMNIPLLGKNAAKLVEKSFPSLGLFVAAINEKFDFTIINGFGEIINEQIHSFFENQENYNEFIELSEIIGIKETQTKIIDSSNEFFDKTIVITGSFEKFNRDELKEILESKGAKVTGSVSKKTNILLCGENAGSKLEKANLLGVRVVFENELENLL